MYKADGAPLCLLRRRCLPDAVLDRAWPTLEYLERYKTGNRGPFAASKIGSSKMKGGGVSKQKLAVDENGDPVRIASMVAGYFEKQVPRFPFCRQTAFVANEAEKWGEVLPLIKSVGQLFEKTLPTRYAKQKAVCDATPPEYVIAGTPFTTITVNNNVVPGGIHTDKGDYKEGFGIIGVLRHGKYEGAWLTFPEYKVAIDMQHGDVLFFNSHDWHGVTPFRNAQPGHKRISVVYYFRSKMAECSPLKEQLVKLKTEGRA